MRSWKRVLNTGNGAQGSKSEGQGTYDLVKKIDIVLCVKELLQQINLNEVENEWCFLNKYATCERR